MGFLICEDAWENTQEPLYQRDPVALLAANRLDLVVSLNASPYTIDKQHSRRELVSTIATTL